MIGVIKRFKVTLLEGFKETVAVIHKDGEKTQVRSMRLNNVVVTENWLHSNKKRTYCYCCNKPYELNQTISVLMTNKGNVTTCNECGEYIKEMLDKA